MKTLKDFSGSYTSSIDFVEKNKLDQLATEIFGAGWDSDEDVQQIDDLIHHATGNNLLYNITVDFKKVDADIIVKVNKDELRILELEKQIQYYNKNK